MDANGRQAVSKGDCSSRVKQSDVLQGVVEHSPELQLTCSAKSCTPNEDGESSTGRYPRKCCGGRARRRARRAEVQRSGQMCRG